MSLTSRERHNPPPRQKSCAACIKAKRRCDAGFPACMRCSQRGIPCEAPVARRSRRVAESSSHQVSSSASAMVTTASVTELDLFTTPLPMGGSRSVNDNNRASLEAAFFNTVDPMLPVFSSQALNSPTLPTSPNASSPFSFNFKPMNDAPLQLIHQPSALMTLPKTEGTGVNIPELARTRLHYAIEQIKAVPRMMVMEMQTPWTHPKLYEQGMPQCMKDAYASCAMYISKTPLNAPFILRIIDSHVQSLLSQPEPPTRFENLAHTQALLLYHIIRIFDGDITSRAAAERTQSALEDSAMALLAHVDISIPSSSSFSPPSASSENCAVDAVQGSEDLPLYPLGPTVAFWKEWIFQESARRTLLFTFFLLQAYRILAGLPFPSCDGHLGMTHSFTLSAPLWYAKTPVQFAKAWKETRHLVVSNGELGVLFTEARAHHLDMFGKIIMTSIMGLDEAEGWFASRGGSLWAEDGSSIA